MGKEEGLKDRSRLPYNSPRQTPKEIEELVLKARKETGLGRKRLAIYLTPSATYYAVMGLKGKSVYPAFWAWETQEPLSFFQVDTKGVWGQSL